MVHIHDCNASYNIIHAIHTNLVPRPTPFLFSVWVQYNKRKRKTFVNKGQKGRVNALLFSAKLFSCCVCWKELVSNGSRCLSFTHCIFCGLEDCWVRYFCLCSLAKMSYCTACLAVLAVHEKTWP